MALSEDDKVPFYLDMWKQTVTVQQHFNDIEWRIRGLALTVLTFALGAAAVASKDSTAIHVFDWTLPLAAAVLWAGLVLWSAFYFVDQIWYHRLLLGAVKHGEALEQQLQLLGLWAAGLTQAISASSPYQIRIGVGAGSHWWSWLFRRRNIFHPIRSGLKMKLFYVIGAFPMLLPAIGLQVR